MIDKPYIRYIWNFFYAFIGIVAVWFTLSALYQLYSYFSLTEETSAKTIEWSVIEITDEKYILGTKYSYSVNGVEHSGDSRMSSLSFRNAWAAEQAIPRYAKQAWTVWFSPTNPDYSTMQKSFPFKDCLSAILLWGILGYFYWLRGYVNRLAGGKG